MKNSVIILGSNFKNTVSSLIDNDVDIFIVTGLSLPEEDSMILESITKPCCGSTGGQEIINGSVVKYKQNIYWVANDNLTSGVNDILNKLSGELTLICNGGAKLSQALFEKNIDIFKEIAIGASYSDYYKDDKKMFLPYLHNMTLGEFPIYAMCVRTSFLQENDVEENLFKTLIKFMSKSVVKHIPQALYKA